MHERQVSKYSISSLLSCPYYILQMQLLWVRVYKDHVTLIAYYVDRIEDTSEHS